MVAGCRPAVLNRKVAIYTPAYRFWPEQLRNLHTTDTTRKKGSAPLPLAAHLEITSIYKNNWKISVPQFIIIRITPTTDELECNFFLIIGIKFKMEGGNWQRWVLGVWSHNWLNYRDPCTGGFGEYRAQWRHWGDWRRHPATAHRSTHSSKRVAYQFLYFKLNSTFIKSLFVCFYLRHHLILL